MGAEARDEATANSVASSAAPSEEIATNAVRAPVEFVETSASVLEESEMTLARADAVESTMPAPEEEEEMLRLRCVDEQGKPVAGAEVYYFRTEHSVSPMLQRNRPEDIVRTPFGPVRSDGDGYVEVPAVDDASSPSPRYHAVYARVPDTRVGAWMHSAKSPLGIRLGFHRNGQVHALERYSGHCTRGIRRHKSYSESTHAADSDG